MAVEKSMMEQFAGSYPDPGRYSERILEAIGRFGTPLMFCESDNLVDRFRMLRQSLDRRWQPSVIAYSFKTNYDVARTKIFEGLGAWAEVVSGREYEMASKLGFPGSRIVFNGPYKTDAELARALVERAIINVNEHDELDRVIAVASGMQLQVQIGLRVSSTLEHYGHSRFGFSLENGEAREAVRKVEHHSHVGIAGLHSHLHGDVDQPEVYATAAMRTAEFACMYVADAPESLRYLDMGGGFPAATTKPYSRTQWSPQPIDVYVSAIANALGPYFAQQGEWPVLILEPGRYLTNDAVLLVSEVVHTGKRSGVQIVNSNASISMVPLTHYRPQLIKSYRPDLQPRDGSGRPTRIYGASCRENDKLYEGPFAELAPGDLLVHFGVGAYNSTLSPEFIFACPSMEML